MSSHSIDRSFKFFYELMEALLLTNVIYVTD
jgi:hypothetical protein